MKHSLFLLFVLLFAACDIEEVPDCFESAGPSVTTEIEVPHFNKILVYGNVKLYITSGNTQKVIVKTGENLLENLEISVNENTLVLKNETGCRLFHDYEWVKIYVTSPKLTEIRNAGQNIVESTNVLNYPDLTLLTENFQQSDYHTDGGFALQLDCDQLRITSNGFSYYVLSGKVKNMFAGFYAGDGRLEASDLVVQELEFFHRSSNQLIVNPQVSLKGEIRSTGDVISVNRPSIVEVEEFYTGSLIFDP